MIAQLENLERQMKEVTRGDGEPMFTLTRGGVDDEKSYNPFEPSELSMDDLDFDDHGKLKRGVLYFGCTEECCKFRKGLVRTVPQAYLVCQDSRNGGIGAKDQLPRLKSFKAAINGHNHANASSMNSPGAGKMSSSSASPKQVRLAASGSSINVLKKNLTIAASLAQASKAKPSPAPQPKAAKASQEVNLVQPEAGAPEAVVFTLPFVPKSNKGPKVTVTSAQYLKAITPGEMVCDEVFNTLRIFEGQQFEKQADELIASPSALPIGDQAALRVRFLETDDFSKLERAAKREVDPTSTYDRMRTYLDLEDAAIHYDVVSVGVAKGLHFSEAIWLPMQDEVYSLDSAIECGHLKLIETVLVPFFDYLLEQDGMKDGPIELIPAPGLAQQSPGSNVCAFTATLFQRMALKALLSLYKTEESDDSISRQVELSRDLANLTATSSSYNRRRREANQDLAQLVKEYAIAHNKAGATETKAGTSSNPDDDDEPLEGSGEAEMEDVPFDSTSGGSSPPQMSGEDY